MYTALYIVCMYIDLRIFIFTAVSEDEYYNRPERVGPPNFPAALYISGMCV